MTNKTSRVRPAGKGAQTQIRAERRRRTHMATLAAAFSLFALYLAWHASHEVDIHHEDEWPIAAALEQDAPQGGAAGMAGAILNPGGLFLPASTFNMEQYTHSYRRR